MKKLLIALAPAILVHLGLLITSQAGFSDQFSWVIWIFIGLLVVGAGMAAYFTGSAMARSQGATNQFVIGLVSLIVFVAYLGGFAFTGCLMLIIPAA